MHWIAPSEKDNGTATLEKRLWEAADQFRANSGLTAAQYSQPVLGLIFLRFAEVRFAAQRARLEKLSASSRRGSRLPAWGARHKSWIFEFSFFVLYILTYIYVRIRRPMTQSLPQLDRSSTSAERVLH
jgi:type I restriction enzyme M protein